VRVLVSGSSGLIGTALVPRLRSHGHEVIRLIRRPTDDADTARWDPARGELDDGALEGIDAVIHLAGEGIGERRWTDEQKRRILDSRVAGTDLLARAIAAQSNAPILFSGSAIGLYGDRGDEELTEESGPGTGFLADVVKAWEGATEPAEDAGARVVHLRTGVVLAANGGALKRMLTPFKLGLGGRIGSGKQWFSWITLGDEVRAIERALDDADLSGPLNLCSPNPVTNAEFTKTLGAVLRRPTFLPTPTFGLKAMLGGELVEEMLLGGQRVLPARLTANQFDFAQPELEGALRALLGKT
jgi:uncharacterized protein (TIGR01777 family)